MNKKDEIDSNQNEQMQYAKVFNKKTIKRGIVVFILLTLLAFIGIFVYTDGAKNIQVWKQINWKYLVGGLLFIGVDIYIGGLRNHIFVRELLPGIKQKVCIVANLANIFMGAVTPSQSGGGLAQWYILYRNGLSIADSIGVSFYGFISTIVFFPLSALMAMYILGDRVPPGFVTSLTKFGFTTFTVIAVIIFLGLFAPQIILKIIQGISKVVGLINNRIGKGILTKGSGGIQTLAQYRDKYLGLIQRKPQLMVFSFVLTIVLYFNKYVLAYVFIVAFGVDVDFWSIVSVMAVCYMFLYFAPSPGGSGIAELSITGLLISFVGTDIAPSITLLHRSFLVFIPALIGAIVVLRQLSKE